MNRSMDSMTGWYRIFREAGIPVDIHHEEFVSSEKLSSYKLVVLPFPICLDNGFNEVLQQYVEAGGMLLSDPAINLFDERLFASRVIPGKGLTGLFGCRQKEIVSAARPKVRFGEAETVCLERSHFSERYTEVAGEVLATYDDGDAAVILHLYGEGKAVLSGVNLGMVCTPPRVRTEKPDGPAEAAVKQFAIGLARRAGVKCPIAVDTTGVTANLLKAGPEGLLFVFNHSHRPKDCRVHLDQRIGEALDLESRQGMPVSESEGRTVVEVAFEGMGVKVLRVK